LISLGNLVGLGDIHLGIAALPFTLFAAVGVMNAFNMIDGIDGLLGVSSLIALIGFTVLSIMSGNHMLIWLGAVCIASLLPYFLSNIQADGHSFKVFMGDAGSLLMGFTVTWLFIVGSQSHLTSTVVIDPVTTLYLVAIPLMDILTVMARRIKQKRSPWLADRQHIHHLFEKAGYSQKQTLIRLTLIMAAIAGLGVFLQYVNVAEWVRFVAIVLVLVGYIRLTKYLKKQMSRVERTEN
jgi:UDP-GlcNAc:undecaprenyl-phosphate GlcNAc-1-phosphate transferase